jgi:hypothetical protein
VGRPIAFTFHASDRAGWEAIGIALDEAKLLVTAVWPLRNDAHMGPHVAGDNCEWDVVVVCRRLDECERAPFTRSVIDWLENVGDFRVGSADRRNFESALEMIGGRFGWPSSTTAQ